MKALIPLSIVFAFAVVSRPAQSTNSQGSAGAQSSASQGSATIENQIIAYEILRQMSVQITNKVTPVICSGGCDKAPGEVLYADPNALVELLSYRAFDIGATQLKKAYGNIAKAQPGELQPRAVFDYLSAAGTLISAIRATATYSNQNFQPTTQSMITLLTKTLKSKNIALRTTSLPGNLDSAAEAVRQQIEAIGVAQAEADPTKRAEIDKEFSSFRTLLGSTTADGTLLATVIRGKALADSLGKSYFILSVSLDAAGGDTRTAHWFLRELFWPTAAPSYNGGAVVSYMLTDTAGTFRDGEVLRSMYGFSKWKAPKVPKSYDFSPPEK